MSEENKKLDISQILNLINDVSKTLETNFYIPSLNQEIIVKPLNTTHTKNILKSAIEGSFASNQFTLVCYHILLDIVDKSIPLSSLTIVDKAFLLLQIRAKNVSEEYELELFNKNDKSIKYKLNLTKFINKLKKEEWSFNSEIVEQDKISISMNYPSIQEEYEFETDLYKTKLANIDEKNEKAMKSLFAPMFINNAGQFISSVNINGTEINMKDLNIQERLAVIEKLPAVIDKIISKIDSVFGKQMNKILTVTAKHDGEEYSGKLDLKSNFFLN
jgi:hypothetical protein